MKASSSHDFGFFFFFFFPDLGFWVVTHGNIGFDGVEGRSLVVLWGVDGSVSLVVVLDLLDCWGFLQICFFFLAI